ncbi:hypothetical protein ACOMHN_015257 [Nucella lapillus]
MLLPPHVKPASSAKRGDDSSIGRGDRRPYSARQYDTLSEAAETWRGMFQPIDGPQHGYQCLNEQFIHSQL